MTSFAKVMLYAVLVLIVAPGCMSGKCRPYNPFKINGTQTPNTTIYPKQCHCYYCQRTSNQKGPVTTKWNVKKVICRQKAFKRIPEDIPVDVQQLDLFKNSISKLSSGEMINFKELKFLDLSFNDLQDSNIGDHFFDCLTKLNKLNLDNNYAINHIPIVWFQKLVALEILNIRYSAVKTLQRGVFKHCGNLTRIYLTGNNLVSLPPDLFRNQPVLRIVDVSHSSINAIQDEVFRGSPEINYFFLHYNKVTTISRNMGLQNLTKLIQIGVWQNPLVCDCNLVWFRHWINQTNATLIELDKTKCRNTNGTSLVNFDADSLICIEHDFTKPVLIATFCSAGCLTVLGTLLYVFRWDIRYT
ncbi:slit homolog 1 protein-like [Anneissia japonica]|uniref:slit homolog 1 protein-like n=1 Tax=Anneissia japonica TaxID=1529436 RepID=UPI001425877E|nr:slit homolog 1 protein-like [Anneissia japonica]